MCEHNLFLGDAKTEWKLKKKKKKSSQSAGWLVSWEHKPRPAVVKDLSPIQLQSKQLCNYYLFLKNVYFHKQTQITNDFSHAVTILSVCLPTLSLSLSSVMVHYKLPCHGGSCNCSPSPTPYLFLALSGEKYTSLRTEPGR